MSRSFDNILEHFHKRLDLEVLDEFKDNFEMSINSSRSRIEGEFNSVSPDDFSDPEHIDHYKDMLIDRFHMLDEVKKLGDELLINGLFKQVELHIKKVVKHHIPIVNSKSFFNTASLEKSLPFKLKTINNYNAYNELRLINNAIKHVGHVSKDLAKEYPNWILGERLEDLDKTLARLQPLIREFISNFVSELARHSKLKT